MLSELCAHTDTVYPHPPPTFVCAFSPMGSAQQPCMYPSRTFYLALIEATFHLHCSCSPPSLQGPALTLYQVRAMRLRGELHDLSLLSHPWMGTRTLRAVLRGDGVKKEEEEENQGPAEDGGTCTGGAARQGGAGIGPTGGQGLPLCAAAAAKKPTETLLPGGESRPKVAASTAPLREVKHAPGRGRADSLPPLSAIAGQAAAGKAPSVLSAVTGASLNNNSVLPRSTAAVPARKEASRAPHLTGPPAVPVAASAGDKKRAHLTGPPVPVAAAAAVSGKKRSHQPYPDDEDDNPFGSGDGGQLEDFNEEAWDDRPAPSGPKPTGAAPAAGKATALSDSRAGPGAGVGPASNHRVASSAGAGPSGRPGSAPAGVAAAASGGSSLHEAGTKAAALGVSSSGDPRKDSRPPAAPASAARTVPAPAARKASANVIDMMDDDDGSSSEDFADYGGRGSLSRLHQAQDHKRLKNSDRPPLDKGGPLKVGGSSSVHKGSDVLNAGRSQAGAGSIPQGLGRGRAGASLTARVPASGAPKAPLGGAERQRSPQVPPAHAASTSANCQPSTVNRRPSGAPPKPPLKPLPPAPRGPFSALLGGSKFRPAAPSGSRPALGIGAGTVEDPAAKGVGTASTPKWAWYSQPAPAPPVRPTTLYEAISKVGAGRRCPCMTMPALADSMCLSDYLCLP